MFKAHPKIEVRPNSLDKNLFKVGYIIIGIHFLITALSYSNLLDIIPIHFNLKGEADGFSNKLNIWFLPLLNVGMFYGIKLLVTKMKPYQMNYPVKVTETNAPVLYGMAIRMLVLLNLSIALLLFLISLHTILLTQNLQPFDFGYFLIFSIGFITLIPFYFIFKMLKLPKT
jgi:uncharacterized membrane protein